MLILRCAAIGVGVFGAAEFILKLADPLCEGGAVLGDDVVTPSAVRERRASPPEAVSFR